MVTCDGDHGAEVVQAPWRAKFEHPRPRTFNVCAMHAARALRNGAVTTPAPIEGD